MSNSLDFLLSPPNHVDRVSRKEMGLIEDLTETRLSCLDLNGPPDDIADVQRIFGERRDMCLVENEGHLSVRL
jgi:hypothetical protein